MFSSSDEDDSPSASPKEKLGLRRRDGTDDRQGGSPAKSEGGPGPAQDSQDDLKHSSNSQSHSHSRSQADEHSRSQADDVKGYLEDSDSDEGGPAGKDWIDEVAGGVRKYLQGLDKNRTDTVFNRHEPMNHQAWKLVVQNVISAFPPDQTPKPPKIRRNDSRYYPEPESPKSPGTPKDDRSLVFDCVPSIDPKLLQLHPVEGFDGKKRLAVTSLFESGNVALVWAGNPNEYRLFLDYDVNTNGYTQWFYFAVGSSDDAEVKAGRRVVFVIENISKACPLFTEGMKPVVWSIKSAGGWHQVKEDVKYNFHPSPYEFTGKPGQGGGEKPMADAHHHSIEFGYTFEHDGDVCFFAMTYPYTYTHLQAYLGKLLAHPFHSRWIRHSQLCQTIAGLRCDVLQISDWDAPDVVGKEKRPAAIVTARVHPGETNGSWMMQGFLTFLTGRSREAHVLRQKMVWHVVPMLNPDGVVYGNTRCNLSGVDLNRQFMKPSRQLQPTIFYLKRRMQEIFREGRRMDFYFDFHGHSKKRGIFFYGNQYPTESTARWKNARIRLFPKLVSLATDDVIYESCDYSALSYKDGSGRVSVFRDFEILYSYTIEASFYGPDPRKKREEAQDVAQVGSFWKQQEEDEATKMGIPPEGMLKRRNSQQLKPTRAGSPENADEQAVSEKKKQRPSVTGDRPNTPENTESSKKSISSKRRASYGSSKGKSSKDFTSQPGRADKFASQPGHVDKFSSQSGNVDKISQSPYASQSGEGARQQYASGEGVENVENQASQRPKSPEGNTPQSNWGRARGLAFMTATLANAKGVRGDALPAGGVQSGVPIVTSASDNAAVLVDLRDMLGELTGQGSKQQQLLKKPPSAQLVIRRIAEANSTQQEASKSQKGAEVLDRDAKMSNRDAVVSSWKSPKCFSWKRLLCVGPSLGHAIVSQLQLQRLVERAGPPDTFPHKAALALRGDEGDCCTCCAADAEDNAVYEFGGEEAQLPFMRFDRLQGRLATTLVQRVMGDADKENTEEADVLDGDASGSDSDPERDQKPAEELQKIHHRIRTKMKKLEITKRQAQLLGNEKLLVAFGRTERLSVRDDRFRELMALEQRRSTSAPAGRRSSGAGTVRNRRPRSAPLEEPGRVRFRFVSSREESVHWWDAVWTNSSSSEGSGASDWEGSKKGDANGLPELMTKVRQERDIREVYAQADDAFCFEYTPLTVRSCTGRSVERAMQSPKHRRSPGHSRFRQRRLQFAYAACAEALTAPGKAVVGPFPPSSRSAVAARHFKREAMVSAAQRKIDDLLLTSMLKQEDRASSAHQPQLSVHGFGKRSEEATTMAQAVPLRRPDSRTGTSGTSTPSRAGSNSQSRGRLQPLIQSRPGSAASQASTARLPGVADRGMPAFLVMGTLTPSGPKMHLKAQLVRAMEWREDWLPFFARHKPMMMRPACHSHPRLARDGPGPPPPSPVNSKRLDPDLEEAARPRCDTGTDEDEDGDFLGPAIVVADDMDRRQGAHNSRPGSAAGSLVKVRQMSSASFDNSDAMSQASWSSHRSGRPSSGSSYSKSKKNGGRLKRPGHGSNPTTAWGGVGVSTVVASREVSSAAGSESGRGESARTPADWSDVSTATSRNAREGGPRIEKGFPDPRVSQ